jgi:uncharacterized protein YdeI (YjbR/CyaY-like superfamily)
VASDDLLDLADLDAWEAWLEAHHDTAPEVWLRIATKHSGLATISISDALAGALCFGCVDGQRKGLDEAATVPDELVAALPDDPVAAAAFDVLEKSERYVVFLPILKATTAAAREREVARAVRTLADRG